MLKQPKFIFIGVYGDNPPSWENAAWFDPQRWPFHLAIDLQNKTELNRIAYHDSLMHVVALHVGKLFPNNLTLMIQDDSDLVQRFDSRRCPPGFQFLCARVSRYLSGAKRDQS